MKAIRLIRILLKTKCPYSAPHDSKAFLSNPGLYVCKHEGGKDCPLYGWGLPDEQCTIDDWKECPLNPEVK